MRPKAPAVDRQTGGVPNVCRLAGCGLFSHEVPQSVLMVIRPGPSADRASAVSEVRVPVGDKVGRGDVVAVVD